MSLGVIVGEEVICRGFISRKFKFCSLTMSQIFGGNNQSRCKLIKA